MKQQEFVNSINVKGSNVDFCVAKLNIKVKDLQEYLKTKEEWANDNNGFITIDILRAKNDRNKMYCKFSNWKPTAQVKSEDHMPDREEADLPF